MFKLLQPIIAAILVFSYLVGLPPNSVPHAHAQSSFLTSSSDTSDHNIARVTVSQGDIFRTPAAVTDQHGNIVVSPSCTIGYLDKVNRLAYTAAHCSETGHAVYVQDTPIGTFHRTTEPLYLGNFDDTWPTTMSRDVAYIELFDNVQLGTNKYSTDAIADDADINFDNNICALVAGAKQCAKPKMKYPDYTDVASNAVFHFVTPIQGDSGGPSWVETPGGTNLGLVGVLTVTFPKFGGSTRLPGYESNYTTNYHTSHSQDH